MFVTLSRRNTSLINQQLGLIETLEKDEEDPQRLESLFRLDHLAARMRRTADSLLILADAPTHTSAEDDLTVGLDAAGGDRRCAGLPARARRLGQQLPASATPPPPTSSTCSPSSSTTRCPTRRRHTTVLLSSHSTTNGVTIEIEDAGLGIPDQRARDINETLRTGGDVTPDTARRMGLFVVSRLAQRHGITVSLERNDHNGTTRGRADPASDPRRPDAGSHRGPPTRAERGAGRAPAAAHPGPRGSGSAAEPSSSGSTPRPGCLAANPVRRRRNTGPPRRDVRRNRRRGPARGRARRPDAARDRRLPSSLARQPSPAAGCRRRRPRRFRRRRSRHRRSKRLRLPPHGELVDLGAGGAQPSPLADSEAEADTPIFKALRSAWLSADATGRQLAVVGGRGRLGTGRPGRRVADRGSGQRCRTAGTTPGHPPRARWRHQACDGRRPRPRGDPGAARRSRSRRLPRRAAAADHRP